jgi:hypothetical protein
MTMPVMFFTWFGICAPLMIGMMKRKSFYRNPLKFILSTLTVAGLGGAIANSIAYRLYEGPMVE